MLGKRVNFHRDYQVIASVLSQERPTIHDLEDAAREGLAHAAASMEQQQYAEQSAARFKSTWTADPGFSIF